MERIRQILLTQYIGAITIGFIFAQALIQFVNAIVAVGRDIWVRRQGDSAFTVSPSLNWTQLLITMSTVALNLLAGFLLLYWLYSSPKADKADAENEEAPGDPES